MANQKQDTGKAVELSSQTGGDALSPTEAATTANPNAANLQLLQSEERRLPPVVQRLKDGVRLPVCLIVVGMAGSGKTTLMTQLQRSLDDKLPESAEDDEDEDDPMPGYCVNLDPATLGETSYDASIDIRDTVNYQQVMEQHQLGPNGAIMTSLNLFATKFDQVLQILERRALDQTTQATAAAAAASAIDSATPPSYHMQYILVDTPGQIEAFTWSASGQIIGEALASAFPTVLCFVVDTVRCTASPHTFMSNMLYACSMLYRTRLPLVVCFNKIDVLSHQICLDWMRDYETFQDALDEHASNSPDGGLGFYGSLTRSLSLVLEEFYSNFANAVGVSAVTGAGMDEFWVQVQKAATRDFVDDYLEDLQLRVQEQEAQRRARARRQVRRMERDLQQGNNNEDEDR